jgi:dipeptidyl aminopeptidase/acylaminoacyl peptidase
VPVEVEPGVTVDAWLVQPAGDRPVPLVVWLQGGGTQYGWQFSHELQLLVAAGHAVLYLNARGSAGYGTAWMRAVSGPRAAVPGSGWGVTDVADVAAVVRATLAAHPRLAPDRVGVMGGSYGGLVTTHLLAQTDLFRAGWAERGPYDLLSDAGTKDEAPWFFEAYLGADHLADRDSYWQASPLRLVEQITAPLAIVHSEEDRRCSIGQAEELFMALKLLDREVELIRFPGECHELTRSGSPVHRLQRLEILLEWFGRHLSP